MRRDLPSGVVPVAPGPGQESVWSYPRPPAVEATGEHVVVELAGLVICDTWRPLTVLETAHPPTYYLPLTDWRTDILRPTRGSTFCEWKGVATYFNLLVGEAKVATAAWTFSSPTPAYAALTEHIALYPAAVDRCLVDGEVVRPQPGGFYGGWITDRVVGPFKGGPGTRGW
jgi:uncharacterized protein (DUF427 family)